LTAFLRIFPSHLSIERRVLPSPQQKEESMAIEDPTRHFRCRNVGYNCDWELVGTSEEEMLPIIEDHAARTHNLTHFKEAADHIRRAIRRSDGPHDMYPS